MGADNADNGAERDGVLWRALVEASPDVVLVVDTTGTILFINRVVPFFQKDGVVGRKLWEFVPGKSSERMEARLREVVETRKALYYENAGYRSDGSPGWYDVRAIPVVVDGSIERIVWSSTDVTERKLAVERLGFQAHVLDQVSQPVVATTAEEIITYWNEAAERAFGYTAAEAIGQHASRLLRTQWADAGFDDMVTTLRAKSAWHGEVTLFAKAGAEVTVDLSIRLVRDETGTATQGITVMQDITARKRLEEQLRQSQKMEAIGLLAGGVAHDFNNLLAVILGFSELATRKLPAGHPVASQLTEVFEAARRGGELTRKLLAFSRKQIIQLRPVDVGAQVDDFTRMIQRIVGEDVELVVERAPETVAVRADPTQLEQVLLNLCTNARQAMPGGGTLALRTRAVELDEAFTTLHPWARAGAFAEITVTDTGVGMDGATMAHVFEPFFTTKREGTGLGLATVYGIVQQHGGFLHVESAPSAGTTFRVYLPRTSERANGHAKLDGDAPVPRELRGTEVILVAEDEPSLRALVTITLTDLGYQVIATRDGAEAVREFERHAADIGLVVLDVVMPRLDAREAYERIRAIRADARVLFTTGYAPASTRLAELLEGGTVPLLEKPFTPLALATKVRSAIDA
ncbi:MAG TPA: PAS domain S-box protein [Polyangiaceae bacterium]